MKELGIEPLLLLAQIVNFGIILFVLSKFLYKPILAMLDKRKKEIEEGQSLAKRMQQEEETLKIKMDKLTSEAKKEARAILEESKKQAEEQKRAIIAEAHKEASQVIAKGNVQAEAQVKGAEDRIRKQVVELASAMVTKLLPTILSTEDHKKLLAGQLKELEKSVKVIN